MKSIATIAAGIFALCGVSFAQVTYNSTTGKFMCALPNASYCASVSLGSPIIIRCSNGIGQPGNCDDNLAGEFPLGVNYSPCWESSNVSGDAACSKNCIVYGGSGNFNGTFTLPNCTAIPTTTLSPSSTSVSLSSTIPTIPTPPTIPVFTPTGSSIPYPTVSFPSGTAVGTGGSGSGGSGSGGSGSGGSGSGGSGSGSGSGGSGVNGTSPNGSGGSGGSGGSATVTPVGPSKTATGTGPAQYTNDASRVGLGMGAILGGVIAGLML